MEDVTGSLRNTEDEGMGKEKIAAFDSTDLRAIDRLITCFEKCHVAAFPYHFPIPVSDYSTDIEIGGFMLDYAVRYRPSKN